jgi:hypothetical protein
MSIAIPSELGPRIIKDKMKLSCFMHNQGGKLLFLFKNTKNKLFFFKSTKNKLFFLQENDKSQV